ncbi:hypothetical protein Tco_0428088 [Tanacetum coccineum]
MDKTWEWKRLSLLTQKHCLYLLHIIIMDKHGLPPTKRCLRSLCLNRPEFIGHGGTSGDQDLPIVCSIWEKIGLPVNGPLQRVLSLPEKIFNLELKRKTRSPTLENVVFDLGVMDSLVFLFIDQRVFIGHDHEVHLAH